MRHTYADTSLARADLGFAPTVGLEEGLAAEHAWLAEILCMNRSSDCPSRLAPRRGRSRSRLRPPARRPGAACPPARVQPDKFLFDRGHRGAEREEVADRARVLPADHRHLHAEPVPARRQARDRRHLPRRRDGRGARARAERVPRVPLVLPDQPARRLRAVQARHDALPPDARRRSAIRPRRARRSGSSRRSSRAIRTAR